MPKIRDLGINTIPVTMRPPEIGEGGMYACQQSNDTTSACPEASCFTETKKSTNHSEKSCPDASCLDDDGDDDEQSGCPDASCVEDDDDSTSACPDASCKPRGHKNASAFSPEAVAQLRQQLEHHIGT
jgi:hypothetical protein